MEKENGKKLGPLVDGAVMLALATALSYVRIYQLPWGGAVTLMSMLPIAVYSLRHGVRRGLFVAFAFSLLQLFQGIADGLLSWGLTPIMLVGCIFLDYILPYTAIGLSGIFGKRGMCGWCLGTVAALFVRMCCHFLSGIVIFKSCGLLWDGFSTDNVYLYSFIYNACYMLPEMLITAVGAATVFKAPQMRRIVRREK